MIITIMGTYNYFYRQITFFVYTFENGENRGHFALFFNVTRLLSTFTDNNNDKWLLFDVYYFK